MKSTGMGKRLGAMALLLVVAGLAGPFQAADAAPLEMVTRAQFDAWFKEISNWGRWGKDDELGTLNLITAEKRKAAAALVRDGVSVSLSVDLNKTADALNTNPFEQTLTVGEFGGHAVAEDRYSVRYHGFAHSAHGRPHALRSRRHVVQRRLRGRAREGWRPQARHPEREGRHLHAWRAGRCALAARRGIPGARHRDHQRGPRGVGGQDQGEDRALETCC